MTDLEWALMALVVCQTLMIIHLIKENKHGRK